MTHLICSCCLKPKGKDSAYRDKLTTIMWLKVDLYKVRKNLNTDFNIWIFCDTCLEAIFTDDTEYLNAAELKRKLLT